MTFSDLKVNLQKESYDEISTSFKFHHKLLFLEKRKIFVLARNCPNKKFQHLLLKATSCWWKAWKYFPLGLDVNTCFSACWLRLGSRCTWVLFSICAIIYYVCKGRRDLSVHTLNFSALCDFFELYDFAKVNDLRAGVTSIGVWGITFEIDCIKIWIEHYTALGAIFCRYSCSP